MVIVIKTIKNERERERRRNRKKWESVSEKLLWLDWWFNYCDKYQGKTNKSQTFHFSFVIQLLFNVYNWFTPDIYNIIIYIYKCTSVSVAVSGRYLDVTFSWPLTSQNLKPTNRPQKHSIPKTFNFVPFSKHFVSLRKRFIPFLKRSVT